MSGAPVKRDHRHDYWVECVAIAAEECGATLTAEQIDAIAASAEIGHENYGMAFYSPPASDGYARIELEWRNRLENLQREFDAYRENAEAAVRKALRQPHDATVSIRDGGEVLRHSGRTETLQW